jgi:hypothetical protein
VFLFNAVWELTDHFLRNPIFLEKCPVTFPLVGFEVFGGFRYVFDVTDTVGVSARQQCRKIALYSGLL